MNNVLHTIIDVLAGRRNLAPHEADQLHETLTPGYTTPPPSDAEIAAAQATLMAARAAANPEPPADPATPDPAPAADPAAAPEGSAS